MMTLFAGCATLQAPSSFAPQSINEVRFRDRAQSTFDDEVRVTTAVPSREESEALFGAPLLLNFVAPEGWNRYAQRPPEEVERRDVEVEMTVNAQGRVQDARVVADGGDPRLASRGQRAAESGRYRPRLVDGAPVDTPGVRFVQPFYVLRATPPGESPADATGSQTARPEEPAPESAPADEPGREPAPPQGGG